MWQNRLANCCLRSYQTQLSFSLIPSPPLQLLSLHTASDDSCGEGLGMRVVLSLVEWCAVLKKVGQAPGPWKESLLIKAPLMKVPPRAELLFSTQKWCPLAVHLFPALLVRIILGFLCMCANGSNHSILPLHLHHVAALYC